MTLNGIMALILRYFTELVYNVVFIYKTIIRPTPIPRFHNLLLIVNDHIIHGRIYHWAMPPPFAGIIFLKI